MRKLLNFILNGNFKHFKMKQAINMLFSYNKEQFVLNSTYFPPSQCCCSYNNWQTLQNIQATSN